ncbi:hypothetical protein HPB50_011824 [Hyalomma asiaticum]|uniref:Uncharacterized protein n=1 Tax=Hyalomma asiaticum TaxID=266040 RepID=A0ACB7RNZ3_HYAAI|nr:hypothetical protein HPB50_011824 [Hyalomma asiaticum]
MIRRVSASAVSSDARSFAADDRSRRLHDRERAVETRRRELLTAIMALVYCCTKSCDASGRSGEHFYTIPADNSAFEQFVVFDSAVRPCAELDDEEIVRQVLEPPQVDSDSDDDASPTPQPSRADMLTNGSRASTPSGRATPAVGENDDIVSEGCPATPIGGTSSLLRKGASPLGRRGGDTSEDGASSVVDPLSSRNSLAETSQTSAADLSSFSSPSATLRRTPSLYDNVDYQESLEAAAAAQTPIVSPPVAGVASARGPALSLQRESPEASGEAVRIFVPYHGGDVGTAANKDLSTVAAAVANGDVTPTNQDPNKITIHVDLHHYNAATTTNASVGVAAMTGVRCDSGDAGTLQHAGNSTFHHVSTTDL